MSNLSAQGITADLIDQHNEALQAILEKLHPIAQRTLPYTTAGPSKGFGLRSRRDRRDLNRLAQLRKALHSAVTALRHSKPKVRTGTQQSAYVAASKNAREEDSPRHKAQAELLHEMDSLHESIQRMMQDRFPKPPSQPDKTAWSTWEHDCISERKKAAKQKEKNVQQLRLQDSKAKKRHIQSMYNNNQKQWNKRILQGGDENIKLVTMLDNNTGGMLRDPEQVTKYVRDFFQQQARPTNGKPKT